MSSALIEKNLRLAVMGAFWRSRSWRAFGVPPYRVAVATTARSARAARQRVDAAVGKHARLLGSRMGSAAPRDQRRDERRGRARHLGRAAEPGPVAAGRRRLPRPDARARRGAGALPPRRAGGDAA